MRKRFKQYIIAIIILLINVLAYIQYTGNINKRLEKQTDVHLKSLIDETKECINIKIEERLETYEAVATFIGNLEEKNFDILESALRNQADSAGYTEFDLINTDGDSYISKEMGVYAENDKFKKACKGKSSIEIKYDSFGGLKGINYYIPIKKDKLVVGILKVYSTLEQFTTFTDVNDLNKYGNVFIVKQDGTLISRGYGLDEVENIKMILNEDKSAYELVKSMLSRKSG